MKKLLFILMLLVCAPSVSAQTRSKSHTSSAAPMSEATFLKKWGTYYSYFSDGIVEYGWPKTFFTQMQQAKPNNFRLKYLGKSQGCECYAFAHILDNEYDVHVGGVAFKGGKLEQFEVNAWTLDPEYEAQLKAQFNWNRK